MPIAVSLKEVRRVRPSRREWTLLRLRRNRGNHPTRRKRRCPLITAMLLVGISSDMKFNASIKIHFTQSILRPTKSRRAVHEQSAGTSRQGSLPLPKRPLTRNHRLLFLFLRHPVQLSSLDLLPREALPRMSVRRSRPAHLQ